MIHSRDSDEESYAVIEEWARHSGRYLGPDREIGMMHCYAGDAELGERYRALGFLLSIPGPVTYPGGTQRQNVARTAPLEQLLVETDAPALTPQSRPAGGATSAYIHRESAFIAQLRRHTARGARHGRRNAARAVLLALPR